MNSVMKKSMVIFALIITIFFFPLKSVFSSFPITGKAYASFQQMAHVSETDGEHTALAHIESHQDLGETNTHEKKEYRELTAETGIYSSFPWWVIVIPFVGALTLFWVQNTYLQGLMVICTSALTLLISLLMYPLVIHGQKTIGHMKQGIYYFLPFLPSFQLNLTFKVDPAALILVLFTGLIWLLTAIYSHEYLAVEKKPLRYNVANLCCLGATLGAFLAGDLFTLYIFYECILLFLYLMVIHRENTQALWAAKVYLYFGVFTGLLLLFGIFLFSHFAGSIEIRSAAGAFKNIHPGLKYLVVALFIIGFAGKAGVFLEHIWMPSSYGSAPCLTAALSSGIMIEVGAYGIFRTVNMIFAPSFGQLGNPGAWITTSHLGYILIWAGIITMFLGALNALFSNHALRLLAYSSISQMGYIIMGIGCAAYMGKDGAMGLSGAMYHIINHALFKVGLFLSVGAVYFKTKELDIRKLGGLWHNLPVAAITFLICALAIAGFPCFNGFASKTMLHHAIMEAYQHSVHLSAFHKPDHWLRIAEIIFIITAGGTFAYNMKLFGLTFLGPQKKKFRTISSSPLFMKVSLILLSFGVVLLGIFPNWLLENFIGPMLPYFGFNSHSHGYHLIYNIHSGAKHSLLPLLYDPVHKPFLASTEVIHNLSGGSTAIFVGGVILLIGLGMGVFKKRLPLHWNLEIYYRKAFKAFFTFCRLAYDVVVKPAEMVVSLLMVYVWIARIKLDLIIPAPPLVHAHDRPFPLFIGGDELAKGPIPAKQEMFKTITQADKGKAMAIDPALRVKGMFDHISKADQKFAKIVGKAINEKGIFSKISLAEEKMSGSVDKATIGMKEYSIFDKVTKADSHLDLVFDKVIFSRFFWGMLTKAGDLKSGMWRSFYHLEELYDKIVDRVIFGIIGSEDLSKIKLEKTDFRNSWFLRTCKKISEIHTGDISSYISWIAATLTIIIAILVGFLYIQTFYAMVVTVTIMIIFFSVLTFFLKR